MYPLTSIFENQIFEHQVFVPNDLKTNFHSIVCLLATYENKEGFKLHHNAG